MSVHVGTVTSEVALEDGRAPEAAPPAQRAPSWATLEAVRVTWEALERDRARTVAEGFDG